MLVHQRVHPKQKNASPRFEGWGCWEWLQALGSSHRAVWPEQGGRVKIGTLLSHEVIGDTSNEPWTKYPGELIAIGDYTTWFTGVWLQAYRYPLVNVNKKLLKMAIDSGFIH